MEQKTTLIIIGAIVAILMLPALFFGVLNYFALLTVVLLVVGGIIGFVFLYNKLLKDF